MAKQYDVVIIGAGVSGLALAARLKKKKKSILIIERNAYVGGKLAELKWEDFTWDKGPSVFTLPQLIDDIFLLHKKDPRHYFNYNRHEISCQYFYENGKRFKISQNKSATKKELQENFDEHSALEFDKYLSKSTKIWKRLGEFFLSRERFSIKDIFKPEMLVRYPFFLSKPMRKTLHDYNASLLSTPELVQLADRYSTYIGSDPYRMGGIYSLVGHVELNIGTFFPKGGMRRIPEALYNLGMELGVDFALNNKSLLVEQSTEGYTIEMDAEKIQAKHLVCGIDHLQFYKDILEDQQLFEKYKKQERSSTALVFYWAIDEIHDDLDLHNIFFAKDYNKEFRDLFELGKISNDPTVYVHISSKVEPSHAPKGKENWFVMLNAPSNVYPSEMEIANARKHTLEKLKGLGYDLTGKILHEEILTAKDLKDKTGAFGGALYGAASNSIMAALERHPNQIKKYPNLYFCGGTAHPGGGIPQALKSAEIVAKMIN